MKSQGRHEVGDLQDLGRWVAGFAEALPEKLVVLLSGEMGAGKTQFTSFLVSSLGGEETASPTFAIHNSYSLAKGTLDHVDLYRIENDTDLESTGFWDLFEKERGIIVVEWANRIEGTSWVPSGWFVADISMEKDLSKGEEFRSIMLQVSGQQ